MAHETIDDLLDADGRGTTAVAKAAGIAPKTLLELRKGGSARARAATVSGLAKALGVEPARVRAAIEASREAAAK